MEPMCICISLVLVLSKSKQGMQHMPVALQRLFSSYIRSVSRIPRSHVHGPDLTGFV